VVILSSCKCHEPLTGRYNGVRDVITGAGISPVPCRGSEIQQPCRVNELRDEQVLREVCSSPRSGSQVESARVKSSHSESNEYTSKNLDSARMEKPRLRARQRLGKYRILQRLGEGGFAAVYKAMDTIEGIRVAVKILHANHVSSDVLRDFRNEVRMTSRLNHPNILPIKDASFIDGRFVVVVPLGERTLADRLQSRMSVETAIDFAEQILQAVAHAHQLKIIHCDIKPENLLIFPNKTLRLADFGMARVARRTVRGSGSGTVGYMAPEQAMGRPSTRSDVFSIGLIVYRMFSGAWPEWPFEWPVAGYQKLRNRVHPDMVAFLRRAIEPNPRKRYADAVKMLSAFGKVKRKTLQYASSQRRNRTKSDSRRGKTK
jgi:serine/threonine protein kinase